MATCSPYTKRKHKSKRLQEAFTFLSSISLDGITSLENRDLSTNECVEENFDLQAYLQRDPNLVLLSKNDSLTKSNIQPPFNHSISVAVSTNVQNEFSHKESLVDITALDTNIKHEIIRSKSTLETAKDYVQNVLRVWNPNRFESNQKQVYGKRIVFVSQHQVPYHLFSVTSYTHTDVTSEGILPAANLTSGDFIDGINLGDGKNEVSYGHLLVPESWKKVVSGPIKEDMIETSIPDYTEMDYPIDDPELTSGKHRTVLKLPSFMISIIQYAKPAELKKDINERFKEKFPKVTITLTKLRSLKAALKGIATELLLDAAVLAYSYVYFEKVVLKTRVTKHNRKYIAGACLLLAIKYADDGLNKNSNSCVAAITDHLRLNAKDLFSCELQVLILLEFALELSLSEVLPIYKRIESAAL